MCKYEHCDSCGCRVHAKARCVVEELPCDVASANVGESATLWRIFLCLNFTENLSRPKFHREFF